MSNRVKAGLCLAMFLVLYVGFVYLTWDSSQVVARQWMALGPIHWIHFASGAFVMFFVMAMLFVGLSLRETKRFEDEAGGGGSTGGSGGTKRVRMPMSTKVIDINTWEPPKGQYHRGITVTA